MPTRQGWGALGAAAAAGLTGRVFGLIELYVIGAALAIAVGIAVVVVNRPLPRLEVRRVLRPALVAVGEPAQHQLARRRMGLVREEKPVRDRMD